MPPGQVGWVLPALAPCLLARGPETRFQPRDMEAPCAQAYSYSESPCLANGGPLPLRSPLGGLSITQGEVNRPIFAETLGPAGYHTGSGARGRLPGL